MNFLQASRPSATTSSVGACLPSFLTRSQVDSVDSASTIMIATSSPPGFVTTRPATTMSKTERSMSEKFGKATHWPSMSETRTPPIGPENGRPEICVEALAALMASTSYWWSGFSENTEMTTWTSLRRPFLKVGRSGRSIRRQVRMASVEGRPSRRKKLPGILPMAYMRSSTSTVSGKKSNWSLGCLPADVVDNSIVSSSRYAVTAPPACLARRPVSKRTVRVPKEPLSMTASANVMSGPSMWALAFFFSSAAHIVVVCVVSSGVPRPVRGRAHLRRKAASAERGDRLSSRVHRRRPSRLISAR